MKVNYKLSPIKIFIKPSSHSKTMEKEAEYIRWFSDISEKDAPAIGSTGLKTATLYQKKFPVPLGFIITTKAFQDFILYSDLSPRIRSIIQTTQKNDPKSKELAIQNIQKLFESTTMPQEIEESIVEAYEILGFDKSTISHTQNAGALLKESKTHPPITVRPSFTEDREIIPFENVSGPKELLQSIKKTFASACYDFELSGQCAILVQRAIEPDIKITVTSKVPKKNAIRIDAVSEGKSDSYFIDENTESIKMLEARYSEESEPILSSHEMKRLANYAKELESIFNEPQLLECAIAEEIYILNSKAAHIELEPESEFEKKSPIEKPQENKILEPKSEEDIESIILRELEKEEDYNPGTADPEHKSNIPPLHESFTTHDPE